MLIQLRVAFDLGAWSFVSSPAIVRRTNFSATPKFRRCQNFTRKFWNTSIIFVQNSSKLEFLAIFEAFEVRKFCMQENSADRPRVWVYLIMIRPNLGTMGRIRQKVACTLLVIGTHENLCSQHKECPASNLSLIHISEPTRPY